MAGRMRGEKMIDWNSEKAAAFLAEPRVKKMIQECPEYSIVGDLGCFTGDLAAELDKKNNIVAGFDCNQEFVDMTNSKENVIAYKTNFEQPIDFPDKSFDALVAGELLEHIYRTEVFLKECHRLLGDDGILILSTPNLGYLGHRIKMLFGVAPPIMHYESGLDIQNPGHVRYFTAQALIDLLEKFGFKVEKVRGSQLFGSSFLGDIAQSWAYHLIVVARKVN